MPGAWLLPGALARFAGGFAFAGGLLARADAAARGRPGRNAGRPTRGRAHPCGGRYVVVKVRRNAKFCIQHILPQQTCAYHILAHFAGFGLTIRERNPHHSRNVVYFCRFPPPGRRPARGSGGGPGCAARGLCGAKKRLRTRYFAAPGMEKGPGGSTFPGPMQAGNAAAARPHRGGAGGAAQGAAICIFGSSPAPRGHCSVGFIVGISNSPNL